MEEAVMGILEIRFRSGRKWIGEVSTTEIDSLYDALFGRSPEKYKYQSFSSGAVVCLADIESLQFSEYKKQGEIFG